MSPREAVIGATTVTAAPPGAAPFSVQAVVEEQDTGLILDIEPVIQPARESYPVLVRGMQEQRPQPPGEVLLKRGKPLRILAVVHDLDREPSCREEWISAALDGMLRRCVQSKIRSLALPLLGTVHGRFNGMHFVRLLRKALKAHNLPYPERVWLIAGESDCDWIARYLEMGRG
jgi:hypothetical protein